MRRLGWIVMVFVSLGACDAVEESLQGQAAPLKEPELPNCSRVLTCCVNLERRSIMPQSLKDACGELRPATDRVITEYQQQRTAIAQNDSTSAETKADLTRELRETTQGTMEPACRCLLEQTVGQISLDDFLAPADCETITTTGQLANGETCEDVTGRVTDPEQPSP